MAIERIKSGISGLDKLIEGGYPKNSVILISGGPGTGKTTLLYNIFAMEQRMVNQGFMFLLSRNLNS